jgi:nucleotide-binding universal stress UspA family protein
VFKDLLVYSASYPQPTSETLISEVIGVAEVLRARLTLVAGDPDPIRPISFYRSMQAIEAERRSINQVARNSLNHFEEEARRRGVAHEGEIVIFTGEEVMPSLLKRARMRDLTILPFLTDDKGWPALAERLIFESGRPVLLLPSNSIRPLGFGRIVVAWDFSGPAARALADSIPLLQRAEQGRLITVVREKPMASGRLEEVARHLSHHDVSAAVEEVDAAGRTIGDALTSAAAESDLLVMGAFGHSRMRDFILGGATRHMLQEPPLPVFLSH